MCSLLFSSCWSPDISAVSCSAESSGIVCSNFEYLPSLFDIFRHRRTELAVGWHLHHVGKVTRRWGDNFVDLVEGLDELAAEI